MGEAYLAGGRVEGGHGHGHVLDLLLGHLGHVDDLGGLGGLDLNLVGRDGNALLEAKPHREGTRQLHLHRTPGRARQRRKEAVVPPSGFAWRQPQHGR